jgi:hypothetical protein
MGLGSSASTDPGIRSAIRANSTATPKRPRGWLTHRCRRQSWQTASLTKVARRLPVTYSLRGCESIFDSRILGVFTFRYLKQAVKLLVPFQPLTPYRQEIARLLQEIEILIRGTTLGGLLPGEKDGIQSPLIADLNHLQETLMSGLKQSTIERCT